MGCICSKSIQDVDNQTADIRSSYPVETLRQHTHADQSTDAVLATLRYQRPSRSVTSHSMSAATTAARRSGRASRTSSTNSLSRSQWKQVHSLARANTNPHDHQIQQLQILPTSSFLQQQQHSTGSQLHSALSLGRGPHGQPHPSHPHSNVIHSMGPGLSGLNPTSSPTQSAELTPAHSAGHFNSNKQGGTAAAAVGDALSPEQVLAVCGAVVEEEPSLAAAGIQPLLLAALCLTESGGCPHARHYRDHLGDVALGLCQMLLSTAQWLASSKGFDRYSTSPTVSDLEQPKICVYYCAAYLSVLGQHDGCRRSESFIVKAYHAGPKGVDAVTAGSYLQKYLKAKHCLQQVVRSMAVTLAGAAAAAGLPPVLPTVAAAAGAADCSVQPDQTTLTQQQQQCNTPGSKPSSPIKNSSSSSTHQGGTGCASNTAAQQVLVFACAAKLVAVLSSRWEPASGVAADEQRPPVPGGAGSNGSTANLIAFIMPARSARQQQQAHVCQNPDSRSHVSHSSSGSGRTLLRRWRSSSAVTAASGSSMNPSSSGTAAAVSALASVSAAAVQAAMLRMSCIDSAEFSTALSNAAIAAASADAVHAGSGYSNGGSTASRSGTAAKPAAVSRGGSSSDGDNDDVLAGLPCVMHIVGHGETLTQIATVCGTGVADILAVNPDIPNLNAVQANDCIALPLPVVPPRLHVIQYGETLHGIAKARKVTLGRLLAKNPELVDPSRVQPGWVIMLPGLKGDSKSGLAMDWLAEAAVEATGEVGEQGRQGSGVVSGSNSQYDDDALCWQQDAQAQQQHRVDQDVPAAADVNLSENDAAASPGLSPFASWACVGLSNKQGAHAVVSTAPQTQPAAAAPILPPVGSGAFMFAVGQSIGTTCCSSNGGSSSGLLAGAALVGPAQLHGISSRRVKRHSHSRRWGG